MVMVGHGIIRGSNIILTEPLSLPEGTEVIMQIEPIAASKEEKRETLDEFMQQPWFGMWKYRDDMADSSEWVKKEREQWNQRITKED